MIIMRYDDICHVCGNEITRFTSQLLCSNRGDLSWITPTRSPQFGFLCYACMLSFVQKFVLYHFGGNVKSTIKLVINYTEKTIYQNSRRKKSSVYAGIRTLDL